MRDFQFLQEQAYQYLRGKILNDELEPEQVYSESQVARELNCSRTPVKDALTRLSHAKYIDIIPSRGFRLHQMTEEDLVSTFQTRVAVESFCALSIMERRNRPDGQDALAHLHELLQKQEQASERSDLAAFLEADILFHRTIMLFFPNADFAELYELHAYRIEEPARHSLREPDRCRDALEEHRAVVDAIESADIGRCYLAVLHHNESTFEHSVRLLSSR